MGDEAHCYGLGDDSTRPVSPGWIDRGGYGVFDLVQASAVLMRVRGHPDNGEGLRCYNLLESGDVDGLGDIVSNRADGQKISVVTRKDSLRSFGHPVRNLGGNDVIPGVSHEIGPLSQFIAFAFHISHLRYPVGTGMLLFPCSRPHSQI